MFVPSHLASGYLLGKLFKKSPWTVYPFMPILFFASVLPDIDGIFSDTVAGHHSILHTPLFWIIVFGGLTLTNMVFKNIQLKPISLGLLLGTQLHLLTDWFTARTVGIQWLFPFSHKDYFLYPIRPEYGQGSVWGMIQNPYFSFYMENTCLFWIEIGVIMCGGALFIYTWINRKKYNNT